MAASSLEMFQKSTADESEIQKLVQNHFLPDEEVLQWRPTNGEDIPTPNTNEIVVLSFFFQCGFGLPTCEFLYGLLHHYEIELVHLNLTPSFNMPSLCIYAKHFSACLRIFPCSKAISC
jgi:hypothetical protein